MRQGAETMEVSYLIEKIYKLATHMDGMTDAARSIAILTGAKSCALVVQHLDNPIPETAWFWGLNVNWLMRYGARFHAKNPRYTENLQVPPAQGYFSEFHCENKDFVATEFYREWCQPQDLDYAAGIWDLLDEKLAIRINLTRGESAGQFDPIVCQQLEELLPHLKRSVYIHKRFIELSSQTTALEDTLTAGHQAVLLIDSDCQVQQCNAAADRIMKGCLSIRDNRLRTTDRGEQSQLDSALYTALSMLKINRTNTPQGGLHIHLKRSGKLPLSAFISPVRVNGAADYDPYKGEYLRMQLIDPGTCMVLDAKQLEQVLGLTTAESRVAAQLCSGSSAVKIAETLSLSPHTVRDHCRSIYSRVGVNKQSEFVAKAYAVLNPNHVPAQAG